MNRINANKKPDKMIILLFFSILSLTAISQNAEKKITIQNKNISLKEAFEQIELQTDYSIAYEQSNLNLKKRQALSLKSASIEKALTQILKGTGYIYKIKRYHIIISLPTPKTETIGEKTQKLTQTIRGIVVDSKTNAPIEYASVYVLEEPSLNSSTDSLCRNSDGREYPISGRSPREAGNKEKPDDQSYGYHRRPYDQHGRSRQICQRLR